MTKNVNKNSNKNITNIKIGNNKKETFDYNNLYDIYDSYKPDINDDNMSVVSSLTHYSKPITENNSLNPDGFEVTGKKDIKSVKSNHTLNIDPVK